MLLNQLLQFEVGNLPDNYLGDIRQSAMRRLNIVLAKYVSNANSQVLQVLKAGQDWILILGSATEIRQLSRQRRYWREAI